jgi:hypothetical protein
MQPFGVAGDSFGAGRTHVSVLMRDGLLRELIDELARVADEAEAFERRMIGAPDGHVGGKALSPQERSSHCRSRTSIRFLSSSPVATLPVS